MRAMLFQSDTSQLAYSCLFVSSLIATGDAVQPVHHNIFLVMPCVGMLQVPDDVFVDASTGQCYPIASSPFLGVESVWNDVNYWVCMQMPEPHSDSRANPQQLSLDLADSSKWEYLLPSAAPQVPPHTHSHLETVHLLCLSMLWDSIKHLLGSINHRHFSLAEP